MADRRYRRSLSWLAACACVAGLSSSGLRAGVAVHRLGEQDFADRAGPLLVAEARAAGVNEAFPFDGTVFGDDRVPRLGKVDFTHAFTAPDLPGDGTLTLGLIGLDSPPGAKATIRLWLDGIEQSNAPFAGVSNLGQQSSASVVSIPVTPSLLADGSLDVRIKSIRARGSNSAGNAISLDFSSLAVNMSFVGGPGLNDGGSPGGNPGGETPGGQTPDGSIIDDGGTGGGDPPDQGGPLPGEGDGNGSGNGGVGNGGGGNGGGHNPPPAIPLPPAVWSGLLGLAGAWWARRRHR